MPTVTAITAQRNPDRANLYLDGKFYCGVAKTALFAHRIELGTEIGSRELDALLLESDRDAALDYAMGYVAAYPCTLARLKKKLFERGYAPAVVYCVTDKIRDYGYVDDEAYARQYAEDNAAKKGAVALRSALREKGVPADVIERVLAEHDGTDACVALARKYAQKGDATDGKFLAKTARYLAGKGFSAAEIGAAMSAVKADAFDD